MRRNKSKRRQIKVDQIYGSEVVARFINYMMLKGKKAKASGILYAAIGQANKKLKKKATEVLLTALENVRPSLEIRSRRIGGATYQIPINISDNRSFTIGMKWLILSARKKTGKNMIAKLSSEIEDAFLGVGASIKRKEEMYKVAKANRAFSHYRW